MQNRKSKIENPKIKMHPLFENRQQKRWNIESI